jgi:hypothetical protein
MGTLGSLLNALITRDTSHLPFSNFEYTPIRIRKEEVLGIARSHQKDLILKGTGKASNFAFYLNIETIFGGIP